VDERRAHPRFACAFEARVSLETGETLDGQAVDISFAGICMHIDRPLNPGSGVRFELWIDPPDRDTSLTLVGRVVWSTPVEGTHQLGATFDRDMDNHSWARLDTLLQVISGTPESP